MEYGKAVPFGTPAGTKRTFVAASWRDVSPEKRDKLRALRLWLQKDLNIRFDIEYWREERDPLDAAASRLNAIFQRALEPYKTPKAQADTVAWAGQVKTNRPNFVRLNVEATPEVMLHTLAHEARHTWQLANFEDFVPRSLAETKDVDQVRNLMEEDAEAYARQAVKRWRATLHR